MRIEGPDGAVVHSEIEVGSGLIMIGGTAGDEHRRSPQSIGGAITQGLHVFVEEIDGHYETARAAGAVIVAEPTDQDYGDRTYQAIDPEGHHWWFGQRISE